jgi:F420-dependent oxidoreductase-like protein
MKISACYPHGDLGFGADFAVRADQLGYHRLWVSEAYGYESFGILGALAARTSRIGLATGIANVFGRSAATLGQASATIDALSGGRFALGLGSSGPGVITGWHGVPYDRPLERIRDYVAIIRMILRRERVRYHGKAVSLDGGIRLLHEPVRADVPVYLGSISPRGIMLAAQIADGWLPNHFAPRHFGAVLAPAVSEGLARAGRQPGDLKLAPYHVPVVVTSDTAAGLGSDRSRLALYIGGMGTASKNYYTDLYQRYGYAQQAADIQRLYLAGDRAAAAAAVTDAMIAEGAIVGTVSECQRRLADFAACGADEVVLSIGSLTGSHDDVLQTLEDLAPGTSKE